MHGSSARPSAPVPAVHAQSFLGIPAPGQTHRPCEYRKNPLTARRTQQCAPLSPPCVPSHTSRPPSDPQTNNPPAATALRIQPPCTLASARLTSPPSLSATEIGR